MSTLLHLFYNLTSSHGFRRHDYYYQESESRVEMELGWVYPWVGFGSVLFFHFSLIGSEFESDFCAEN